MKERPGDAEGGRFCSRRWGFSGSEWGNGTYFPHRVFHSLKPLRVFSFLSLASVSLLPVPSGSPLRAGTTPILLTDMSPEPIVGAQQMARMCTLVSSRRRRWVWLLGGLCWVGCCHWGRGEHGKGVQSWVRASQVFRGQYLVAEVTTICDGDVTMETDHLGGEGSSRRKSCGRGWGEEGGHLPRGLPSPRVPLWVARYGRGHELSSSCALIPRKASGSPYVAVIISKIKSPPPLAISSPSRYGGLAVEAGAGRLWGQVAWEPPVWPQRSGAHSVIGCGAIKCREAKVQSD